MQNKFLNYAAFKCDIHHTQHDYSNIRQALNIQALSTHRDKSNFDFLYALLKGFLDVPDLLALISIRIQIYSSRTQSQFCVPTHKTNHGHNHTLYRMLRAANNV